MNGAGRLLTVLLLAAGLAGLASSSGGDREEKQERAETALPSGVTEEVVVRLVRSPIVATDRKGRPITDLTAEEIRVKDRGRVRKVAFLEPLLKGPATEPLPKTFLFLDVPGSGGGALSESGSTEPRYIAIVIDVENDPPLGRMKATDEAVRFVRERVSAESRVAVFSYTGEIHQEILFTPGDNEEVAYAVMRAFGRPGRPKVDLRARIRELVSEFRDCVTDEGAFIATASDRCLRDVATVYADQLRPAAKDYLSALEGIVRMMGGLAGSKVIYALSHGVSTDPTAELAEAMRAVLGPTSQINDMIQYLGFGEGARLEMDRFLELVLREDVVFHFVDRTAAPSADFHASQAHANQPGTRPTLAAHVAAQNDLEEIATTTGGTFTAETDVFEGLSEALSLEAGSYVVGYYVDELLSRKQMRKISIRATRKGVKVAHRRGSYDQRPLNEITGEVLIGPASAAKSRRSIELGLSEHSFVPFQIVADPRGIRYEPSGDDAVASFTLHVQLRDAAGRVVADGFRFLNHSYPLRVWKSQAIEPIRINGWVELPAGSYQLVARFRNPANGRHGELVQALEVAGRPGA